MFYQLRKLAGLSLYAVYYHAWSVIFTLLITLYFGGYAHMLAAGETDIVDNYTWWFFVTVTTVGYGDYSPVTSYGRFGAIGIMLVGIGVLALVIAKITETILDVVSKKTKGLATMSEENHTVIMGYRKQCTEKIIEELLCTDAKEEIVLCSYSQESNPIRDKRISFVKGELASTDVLKRSACAYARRLIVHGEDDNQTFFTAYAIREINPDAHLVCYLNNADHADKIYQLRKSDNALNQVILPVNVYLMAQELQDPESSNVFQHLISNLNGATLFREDVPSTTDRTWTFESVFMHLKKEHNATAIAIKNEEILSNPDLTETVKAGTTLFYIATARLSTVNWDEIVQC